MRDNRRDTDKDTDCDTELYTNFTVVVEKVKVTELNA